MHAARLVAGVLGPPREGPVHASAGWPGSLAVAHWQVDGLHVLLEQRGHALHGMRHELGVPGAVELRSADAQCYKTEFRLHELRARRKVAASTWL